MKKTSLFARCLTLLILALLSTNLAWGETYTISFAKGTTNGTNISTLLNSQATTTICSSGGDNISSYSSTNCYYNTNGCGLRLAKSGDAGSLTLTFSDGIQSATIKEVIIYASAVASGNTLDVTPAGTVTTKTTFNSLLTYSTQAEINTYAQTAISINGTLTSLTFGAISKKYVHLHQIDIVTSSTPSTEPSLSVSPTTIDFGEVYQNADVEGKEVTVTFANLTADDVKADMNEVTAFTIDKYGPFTSGDKIKITPIPTYDIRNYEETLRIFSEADELEAIVTIKMKVVEAPVMKNYTLVKDASKLKAGDIIVIGATKDDNSYVAGALSGDLLLSKEAQVNNGILSASDAAEFTLGGEEDSWTLTSIDGTLGATAVKKLTYDDTKDGFVNTWTISIGNDDNATISSTGDGYGRFLYNVSSPRFLTYTSDATASMLLPQIYRKEVSAKITSTGFATFSSDCPLNLSNLPEGLTAYYATYTQGKNYITMKKAIGKVEANTGLFLKGTANASYAIPVATEGNPIEGNILMATTGEALQKGDYVYRKSDGYFYPLGTNFIVSKGKAYIPASKIKTEQAVGINFEGTPTGVEEISYNDNDNLNMSTAIFNLQGMRVITPKKGEVYIMNGKKFLMK